MGLFGSLSYLFVSSLVQPRAWALENSLTRLSFFVYFREIRKKEATDLTVNQLRGSTIVIISAHLPGHTCHATCGRVRALARVQVLQNSGSQMVVLRFTTMSSRDRHWRNPRKTNYRECSNIKSARVSALTGSMPRKMAEALQSDSTSHQELNPSRPTLGNHS